MNEQGKRVLILGASYGGLYCAKFLHDLVQKSSAPKPKITIIDRKNYILYTAFLPELVSNQVNPLTIAPSVRRILGKRDVEFVEAEILDIDVDNKRAITSRGTYEGDVLVIALGGVTNYFGNENFEKYGYPCKWMPDGLALRNHVIDCLEKADRSTDLDERRRLLTFVQAGAGACGMEVMTELTEFLHRVCGKAYKNINFYRDVHMILAEGLGRVLSSLEEPVSRAATEKMRRRGIDVRVNTFVTDAGPGYVDIKSGDQTERIETETLIWVAGVKANPLVASLPLEHDRAGRIIVDRLFQVPGKPDVYSVGDCAHCPDENGQPLATTAQVAVQQGPALARNLIASWEGREMTPFKFWYRGDLVSIGSLDAVCTPFGWNIFGATGWLLFKYVYFSKLPTWQSRLRVLSDWILNYLQGPSIARLEYDGVEQRQPVQQG
ncbi:MAG: NAD(P)/FAD-dependent oxidoreductase [Anaerolineae bacterium]|jgi:NADH dehydrogenase